MFPLIDNKDKAINFAKQSAKQACKDIYVVATAHGSYSIRLNYIPGGLAKWYAVVSPKGEVSEKC